MSVTGYERQFYADIQRIADNLEKQNEILEQTRVEVLRIRLEQERQSAVMEHKA